MNWPGTNIPISTHTHFTWRTGEPTVFSKDNYFLAKGKSGMSTGEIASISRERSENNGKDVATVHGIGKLVIDKINMKSFHVHGGKK